MRENRVSYSRFYCSKDEKIQSEVMPRLKSTQQMFTANFDTFSSLSLVWDSTCKQSLKQVFPSVIDRNSFLFLCRDCDLLRSTGREKTKSLQDRN